MHYVYINFIVFYIFLQLEVVFKERDSGNMSTFTNGVLVILFLNLPSLPFYSKISLKNLHSDPVWVFSLLGKTPFISDLQNLEDRLFWVWIHSFYKYIHSQYLPFLTEVHKEI